MGRQITINLDASTVAALEPYPARRIEEIVEQYVANQKPQNVEDRLLLGPRNRSETPPALG
jgi:hypothetical protein